MGQFLRYEACPRCRERGADRRGDNLAYYADGSLHCFSCGYHKNPRAWVPKVDEPTKQTGPLPRDFTRDVPAVGWKWLLQYGLPYTYWKPFTGYSPAENRLVITHGNPIETSVGRALSVPSEAEGGMPVRNGSGKWKQWGDKSRSASLLERPDSSTSEGIVLVEDIVSAHKVRGVAAAMPLFGTNIYDKVLQVLRPLKRPITLWLDRDQYPLLAPKLNRLQTFLDVPVRFISTDKDPKEYSLDEIAMYLRV